MSTSELKNLAIKLQDIIDCFPSESESPFICYDRMVKQMQYACDFSADVMMEVIPDFNLKEDARKYIIGAVLKDGHDDNWPLELIEAKAMLQLEAVAKSEENSESDNALINEPLSVEYDAENLTLPRLPRVLEIISHHIPEGFEPALVIAMLPVLGTLATEVRFMYRQTGEIHSFSFMSCLMAGFGGGKSFANNAINMVLEDFKARSAIEMEKLDAYLEARNRSKVNGKEPTISPGSPRYLGIKVTEAGLRLALKQAHGRHLFSYSTEIDSIVSNLKKGWAPQTDVYRKAFDNSDDGGLSIGGDSSRGDVKIYYNLLLAGTPIACMKFFNNVEDGMASRVPIAILPSQIGKGAPIIQPYSEAEKAEIKRVANYLESCNGTIKCLAVDKAIKQWEEKKIQEELNTDKKASINQLRIRAAVIGYRAGMLCYLLEKDNPSFTQADIMKFATWVADYTFCTHMQLYSAEIERNAVANATALHGGTVATVKIHQYLAKLPQRFTREDVKKLYEADGRDPNEARKLINRWLNNQGRIKEVDGGYYEKVV